MGIITSVVNSILLGIGLAMDAFSVSMANGLNEPNMKKRRMCAIAGTFGGYQFLMPMVGWICVHTIVEYFQAFEKFIPWIALMLLAYIGGKMLIEGIADWKGDKSEEEAETAVGKQLTFAALMLQGVATSIDALSVGFAIANYSLFEAFYSCVIIAIVTFAICMGGLRLGKTFGARLAGKASILGGVILICIGLEIFISGVFF